MLEEAVQLRLRGDHFFSRFTFTHPGLIRILKTATENLELADTEQRRVAFERLARLEGINDPKGRPIRSTANDLVRASTLSLIARLSEAPVVCTQEERRLHELLFERVLDGGLETIMAAPAPTGYVPEALDATLNKDAFVIWAPTEPAWRTSLAVYALDRMNLPVIVVCRDGALSNVRARFVRPADARSVLSAARAVLDLAVNDPGDALAIAKLGIPLAVSYLSGAYELLDGVATYRSWMQSDIELAALTALGLTKPRLTGAPAHDPIVGTFASGSLDGKAYASDGPDGAVLFDDHFGLLVAALDRSGADYATSQGIQQAASGYTLVTDAFSLKRVNATGTSHVRVPRITGFIPA